MGGGYKPIVLTAGRESGLINISSVSTFTLVMLNK